MPFMPYFSPFFGSRQFVAGFQTGSLYCFRTLAVFKAQFISKLIIKEHIDLLGKMMYYLDIRDVNIVIIAYIFSFSIKYY